MPQLDKKECLLTLKYQKIEKKWHRVNNKISYVSQGRADFKYDFDTYFSAYWKLGDDWTENFSYIIFDEHGQNKYEVKDKKEDGMIFKKRYLNIIETYHNGDRSFFTFDAKKIFKKLHRLEKKSSNLSCKLIILKEKIKNA